MGREAYLRACRRRGGEEAAAAAGSQSEGVVALLCQEADGEDGPCRGCTTGSPFCRCTSSIDGEMTTTVCIDRSGAQVFRMFQPKDGWMGWLYLLNVFSSVCRQQAFRSPWLRNHVLVRRLRRKLHETEVLDLLSLTHTIRHQSCYILDCRPRCILMSPSI